MDDKLLFKMSALIFQKLTLLEKNNSIELLERLSTLAEHFNEITLDAKRIALALNRNWLFAAQKCRESLVRTLDEIPYNISNIKQLSEETNDDSPAITVSQIFEELKQIQQEFSGFKCSRENKTISIVTNPITLEDVYLGPFQIELRINKLARLYNESPYNCIALEPNPAENNSDVTHPHVSGEKLCEGEGFVGIKAALKQGRLYDFFNIVNSILNTYSPDSPYVALDEWENGSSCYDCGNGISSDDTYYCGFCDREYCENCCSYCKSCDESCCLGCGGTCPNCEEFVCRKCLKRCAECGESFCKLCMEDSVCETCKEQPEILENKNNETAGKHDNFKMAG